MTNEQLAVFLRNQADQLESALEKVREDLPEELKVVIKPMFDFPGAMDQIIYPVLLPIEVFLGTLYTSIDILLKGEKE